MNSSTTDISSFRKILRYLRTVFLLSVAIGLCDLSAYGGPFTSISIDGSFSDWGDVPSYFDAAGGSNHTGTTIPDVHDTDHSGHRDVPGPIDHPDVDILEYKFTHDENNLYAYFRSAGQIGATQNEADGNGRGGRYYVIVTIDVDNDDETGYWLHEGGYFPTSDGYDMNMEVEFYNGEINTAHYLSHDAFGLENGPEIKQDFVNLTQGSFSPGSGEIDISTNPGPHPVGFVQPDSGTYDNYTQWVYHENDTLTLVEDRGPVVQGIMSVAISPDGHELEMAAPFRGFLNNAQGVPNVRLDNIIDLSFSLEASGELASPPGENGQWASDTGDTIFGYHLETYLGDISLDGSVDAADAEKMFSNWAGVGLGKNDGDLDQDNIVDAKDAGILFSNWTDLPEEAAAAATPTPEPSGIMLALLALWGGSYVSRRLT